MCLLSFSFPFPLIVLWTLSKTHEWHSYTNLRAIATFLPVARWSRNIGLPQHHPRGSWKRRSLSSTPIASALKTWGAAPDLAFPTSSPVMQMLPMGDRALQTTAQDRRVKEPPMIHRPTATINDAQQFSFHRFFLPCPSSTSFSRKYRKASYFITAPISTHNSKTEQSVLLNIFFLENAQS